MQHILKHPSTFKIGTRIMMLRGRHKDGLKNERCILRVTHTEEQFDHMLAELVSLSVPGERIYASAGTRSMQKAIREFKRRQLDADYYDTEIFYRDLFARWTSCLMSPTAQEDKIWIFDCDELEGDSVMAELEEHYYGRKMDPYRYSTKTGEHIVVQAFNRASLSEKTKSIIHENAMILWGWGCTF